MTGLVDKKYSKTYCSLEHNHKDSVNCFVINWTFYNLCNYSCSYCEPRLYDGSFKALDYDVYKNFIDKIFELKSDKDIVFNFTGGEITLYPYLQELLSYIQAKGGYSVILSNGSRPLSWWEPFTPYVDQFCLSYHSESVEQSKFFEVVNYLKEKSSVHVNLMMLPEKFDSIYEFAQRLSRDIQGISIELQPLFENFSGARFKYTDEQSELLKYPNLKTKEPNEVKKGTDQQKVFRGNMNKVFSNGDREEVTPTSLIVNNDNIWFGWDCYVGVENIVVGMDGSIRNSVCKIGGVVGWITDENLTLPTQPVVCIKKSCTCAFDIMAKKIKK